MRQGVTFDQAASKSAKISSVELQQTINGAIAVMTTMQDRKAKWRAAVVKALQVAQLESDSQNEVDFFSVLLNIIDGEAVTLPDNHPYAPAIAKVQAGIPRGKMQNKRIPDVKFGRKRMKQKQGKRRR